VCEIRWEAAAGERLRAVVRVTNTSRDDRNFQFWAKGFQVGNKTVPLTVSPAAERLKAGGSTSVVAEFTPTHDFQAGQTYTAELLIEGAYEQCVCFQFTPVAEVVARCEVEQGDPPIRLRAHHWYDHFRCAEPCVQPGESFSTPGLEALKRQIKE